MYPYNRKGKKERRGDIRRLWNLLHDDSKCFSKNLKWFIRKAQKSKVNRSFDIMFATYLSVMIKADNLLFLGNTYWVDYDPRITRVYRRLMQEGYALRIYELAQGAAYLYKQSGHTGYTEKSGALQRLAEFYKSRMKACAEKDALGKLTPEDTRNMVRCSNHTFAQIYDIVESGTGNKENDRTYYRILVGDNSEESFAKEAEEYLEKIFEPEKYRRKQFWKRLKLKPRNNRKKIDWRSIYRADFS